MGMTLCKATFVRPGSVIEKKKESLITVAHNTVKLCHEVTEKGRTKEDQLKSLNCGRK